MNNAGGFITLHRQILDWEWYKDVNTFKLFLHLLLRASFADTRFLGKKIKRGQVVTSLAGLAEETGLSVQNVKTSLKHLILTNEVTNVSNKQYRIITIVKYDEYQDLTNKLTASQQTTNKRLTNSQQHNNNNNNVNNVNNVTNTVMATDRSSSEHFEQFWKEYPKKVAKKNAMNAWQKVNPDSNLFEKIMDGLKRWRDSGEWDRDGGQYIPYPATWLNGKRWEDEVERVEQNGTNKSKRVDYSWLPD